MITLEIWDGTNWVDVSDKLTEFSHKIASRELEAIEFTLVNQNVTVGQRVRAKRGDVVFFEGIVYERERRVDAGIVEVRATAYCDLIVYDRYVVYRLYATGTTAGSIIRDLASLESGVDVTNVDDGPALNSPWEIQNETALQVMTAVARGTNYYLRMKPGKVLYFKPKVTTTPTYIITDDKIISAEYSEDRWRLKNRVIYVGANGKVLADVSEGAGDLPVVVHDPFLTDPVEAQRRANIRLALNKEYGRQLKVVMPQSEFEVSSIDLFSTVAVNLLSLGINENMYVVEVEYDPHRLRYTVTLGGRLELLEEFLGEKIGGDVAARFGGITSVPEMLSTLASITDELSGYAKVSASTRHPVYVNKPPLNLYNSHNITLNSMGEAVLISGATSGSFETRALPPSGLTFVSFVEAYWDAYAGGGAVSAEVLDPDDHVVVSISNAVATRHISLPRWPRALNHLTYRSAHRWVTSGASVANVKLGPIGGWCLKLTPNTLGSPGEIRYPNTQNLGLDIGHYRYIRLYLYGDHVMDFAVTIRLHHDADNYLEGTLLAKASKWEKYEAPLKTFNRVGDPTTINWLSITSPYVLLIDSDHVLLSHVYEMLRIRFNLSRPSATAESPRVGTIRIVWREGGA